MATPGLEDCSPFCPAHSGTAIHPLGGPWDIGPSSGGGRGVSDHGCGDQSPPLPSQECAGLLFTVPSGGWGGAPSQTPGPRSGRGPSLALAVHPRVYLLV